MSPAPDPGRPRPEAARCEALDRPARGRGIAHSDAERQAIVERGQRRAGLANEAQALMEDPGYREEARDVADLMQEKRRES